MAKLSDIRIAKKVFMVIAALGAVTVIVSGIGLRSMGQIKDGSDQIRSSGIELLTGARLRQQVIAINRAQYRMAADPTAETIAYVSKDIPDRVKQVQDYLDQLEKTADTEQKTQLKAIRVSLTGFERSLEQSITVAKEHGDEAAAGITDAQRKIASEAISSRKVSDALEGLLKDYTDITTASTDKVSNDADTTAKTANILMIMLSGGGILVGIALAHLISSRGIVGPIQQAVGSLRSLASGDLETEVFGVERKDEVGDIAKTMLVFKENALQRKHLEEKQDAERHAKELRAEKVANRTRQFDDVVRAALTTVSSASDQMEKSAQVMQANAHETNVQSSAVATASEQAASNVQTVAAATEELASSIKEISRQVSQSTQVTAQAVEEATKTKNMIRGLDEAAQKIGLVVSLITDIAEQTNLLALNATIEAARAGDAGKGFAVVASEVKALASQTAKATEEISGQIIAIQAATKTSVEAIDGIFNTISKVNEISTTIASAVEEQGAATQEISRNVEQAAAGTHEVSSNIVGVTQAAGETGKVSASVLDAARELARQSGSLRTEVDGFLYDIKEAA